MKPYRGRRREMYAQGRGMGGILDLRKELASMIDETRQVWLEARVVHILKLER